MYTVTQPLTSPVDKVTEAMLEGCKKCMIFVD